MRPTKCSVWLAVPLALTACVGELKPSLGEATDGIRGNRVLHVGNMSLGVNACDSCLIENNVVVRNDSDTGGIMVPDRPAGANDLALSDVMVRNNTVYIGPDGSGLAIRLKDGGANMRSVSNVVLYEGSSWLDCYDYDTVDGSFGTVDHNACYGPGASSFNFARGHGDLASFQGSSGKGGNSIVADPGFSDAPGGDFTIGSDSSPLVGAGHPTESAERDADGELRDASPDIGAHER